MYPVQYLPIFVILQHNVFTLYCPRFCKVMLSLKLTLYLTRLQHQLPVDSLDSILMRIEYQGSTQCDPRYIIQVSSKWLAVFLKEKNPAVCTVQLILHVAVTRASMANRSMSKVNIFVRSKSEKGNCFKKKNLKQRQIHVQIYYCQR